MRLMKFIMILKRPEMKKTWKNYCISLQVLEYGFYIFLYVLCPMDIAKDFDSSESL